MKLLTRRTGEPVGLYSEKTCERRSSTKDIAKKRERVRLPTQIGRSISPFISLSLYLSRGISVDDSGKRLRFNNRVDWRVVRAELGESPVRERTLHKDTADPLSRSPNKQSRNDRTSRALAVSSSRAWRTKNTLYVQTRTEEERPSMQQTGMHTDTGRHAGRQSEREIDG